MSLGNGRTSSFLAPLIGRTATFLVESREANLAFARTFMGQAAEGGNSCAIFDLDALYSSNSKQIFQPSWSEALGRTIIRVPPPGADMGLELARLFEIQQEIIIIDSMNTLFHLIAQEDGSSRSKKLSFALAGLSYFVRTNAKLVILSMYRREGLQRGGSTRPISSLTECTVDVGMRGQDMIFRSERGPGWPGGRFSIRIPSE